MVFACLALLLLLLFFFICLFSFRFVFDLTSSMLSKVSHCPLGWDVRVQRWGEFQYEADGVAVERLGGELGSGRSGPAKML